jgi:hypothetical protein
MATYYDIFGINEKAEVENAFRKLAKLYYPDLNFDQKAGEKFIEIEIAYGCLSDQILSVTNILSLFGLNDIYEPLVKTFIVGITKRSR